MVSIFRWWKGDLQQLFDVYRRDANKVVSAIDADNRLDRIAMADVTIKVARSFSREPAGRFRTDGPHSGERFRDDVLVPALKKNAQITVDLDGTEGYGSSFLEEAFGGLVRLRNFTAKGLHQRLILICTEDESIPVEIWEYIDTAIPGAGPKRRRA